jgi:hypothetical protein
MKRSSLLALVTLVFFQPRASAEDYPKVSLHLRNDQGGSRMVHGKLKSPKSISVRITLPNMARVRGSLEVKNTRDISLAKAAQGPDRIARKDKDGTITFVDVTIERRAVFKVEVEKGPDEWVGLTLDFTREIVDTIAFSPSEGPVRNLVSGTRFG